MTKKEQGFLQTWFECYAGGFRNQDGLFHPLLELKYSHSLRVAENARFIADALRLPEGEQRLAEGVALVHDVGRFSQFAQYASFQDAVTVDHGVEGRRILEAQDLSFLSSRDHEVLLCVVEWHNRKQTDVPSGLHPDQNQLLRLTRDADKLDIMELVLRAVASDGFKDLPDMLPHISLSMELSLDVMAEAVQTKSVSSGNLSTLADFLVMIALWFYDLNYPPTRQLAVERNIWSRIRRALPDVKVIRELLSGIPETMPMKH